MVKKSFKASVQDDRFQKIYSDPRFRTLAKKERKIQLDPRFQAMFTETEFQPPVPGNVDERGKKVKQVFNPLAKVFDTSQVQCIDEEGNFKWEVQSSSSSDEDVQMLPGTEVEENVVTGDETLRIAVMNCDWNLIKAVDILAILRSFSPGVIKVSIYPSDFGKARLNQESKSGPALSTNSGEVDEEALRRYELETMKYYYAVAECDSLETSRKIYDDCDGLEIERTSNVLDLRFVPSDLSLPYAPTDVATEVPKHYKMLDYYTKSLQQSRVTLTWDETPRERVVALRKAFNDDHLDDEEIAKYMATPSPPRDEEEEEVQPSGYSGKMSQFNRMNGNLDLEIKFHSAFEQIGKEILNDDKSLWEKQLEKQRKKKKVEKEKRKEEKMKKNRKVDVKSLENLKMLVDSKGDVQDFSVNVDDERFRPLFDDNLFGIDPTSNLFRVDPDGNKLLLNSQIQKRKRNN
jgi:hypothetical protein